MDDMREWTGLMWLKTVGSDEIIFHKMWGNFLTS